MDILIVAATEKEIKPAADYLAANNFTIKDHRFEILISGVGSIATAYNLSKKIIRKRPGFIIQAGIAGSFNNPYKPGDAVIISREIMADMGAEENNEFKDVFDLGLVDENDHPFSNSVLKNPYIHTIKNFTLPMANGITVNEISTRQERIELLQKKYNAQTESMEGAAFHYVCLHEDIPFIQLRAVSNFIGERDKSKWLIKPAIDNLNKELIRLINAEG